MLQHTSMMMVHITIVVVATFACILLLVANNVAAVDYMVGDMLGWTNGVDFQGWAKDKVFKVGDRLVFQYSQGFHNVYKVDGEAFENCDVPFSEPPLSSGNDIIELKKPGKKWYICGIADHCADYEQKLAINVVPDFSWWLPSSPPPSRPPIPSRPWFPWPFPMPSTPAPAYGGYSNSKYDEPFPCFPWPMPMIPPSSPPAYGGYSDTKNAKENSWFPWPMAPSPHIPIPPFWIPYIPVGNAPSPSPYFSTGDRLSSDKNTNNNAEAPWMLPTLPFPCWVPGMFPPAIAPSPTDEILWAFPIPSTPSPSPSYAMNEYSSDAYGVKGKIAQTLLISVGIVLAMTGLV